MKFLPLLVVFALALPSPSFAADATAPAPVTKAKKKKAPAVQKSEPKAEQTERHSGMSSFKDEALPDMAGRFGAGGMMGNPISISAKYWFNSKMSAELGLGYGFFGTSGFEPFADFLYDLGTIFGTSNPITKRMSMYVGGGAFAVFGGSSYGGVVGGAILNAAGYSGGSTTLFGFYIPVGVTWMPTQVKNLEVFAQVGPGLGFGSTSAVTLNGTTVTQSSSSTSFVVVGGAGARYYFN